LLIYFSFLTLFYFLYQKKETVIYVGLLWLDWSLNQDQFILMRRIIVYCLHILIKLGTATELGLLPCYMHVIYLLFSELVFRLWSAVVQQLRCGISSIPGFWLVSLCSICNILVLFSALCFGLQVFWFILQFFIVYFSWMYWSLWYRKGLVLFIFSIHHNVTYKIELKL
jgi:hypothetical protein